MRHNRISILTAMILAAIMILAASLSAATSALAEDKYAVAIENVIIRTKPSKESEGQKSVKAGQKMEILDGGTSGWLRVKYGVIIGYVSKDYVKVTTAAAIKAADASTPAKIADIGTAPSPTKEGARGADVTKLQQALKIAGYYKDNCDGIYGDKTVAAVKAFQKANKMSEDGVAGAATIRILFDVPASAVAASATVSTNSGAKYKTLKLDWFKGGSDAIPQGANFKIKDVRSGRVFDAHHLYGTNH
ncbi:MAG: peptidoglycan-binding protein, partial [Oscillospiraceae bacterium]|nr:peptidoglycan-binding protein [Oscillospiraceae bacterium]